MKELSVIDIENLHHAYLIEDAPEVFSSLQNHLKVKDSEIHIREFDHLGIEDSRDLMRIAQLKSFGKQIFIYRARSFGGEAQNALLKLFEEPPVNTHFFICVSGVCDILPTLRSRAWVIESFSKNEGEYGKEFLALSLKDRISLIEGIVKEKDLGLADKLLREVEISLYNEGKKKSLKHIINVRKVIHTKGASLKVLLESVALTV